MARPRKKQDVVVDAGKMRDIEAYTHDDKKRTNNPPVGMAQHDKAEEKVKTYQFDPHLDPTLQWAGKAEGTSFDVPTSSIHIHESIIPHSIISRVMKEYSNALEGQLEGQQSLFPAETPAERMRRRKESIEFYQHGVDWTNRLIAGDSLVIMADCAPPARSSLWNRDTDRGRQSGHHELSHGEGRHGRKGADGVHRSAIRYQVRLQFPALCG